MGVPQAGNLQRAVDSVCHHAHNRDASRLITASVLAQLETEPGADRYGSLAGGGSESCVACHGASTAHKQKATKNPPDVSFGPEHPSDPEVRSASCLGCHNTGDQLLWVGSEHHKENLSCDSCHNAHERKDMILGEQNSQEVCLDCHTEVKSQLQLPSRHPIAEGKTDCTDCHNPHGSAGEALLRQVTLNDNCFSCHADKRGPFLWEHPPVAEDCALCHKGTLTDKFTKHP